MKFWGFILVFLFTLLNDVPVVKPSKCSRPLTKNTGSFRSPRHYWRRQVRYPDNSKCNWHIALPSGGNVTIKFTKFHTEACCDYVRINNEKGDLIGQYSGFRSNFSVTVTATEASRVDITFTSDRSVSGPGFEAYYIVHGKPVNRSRAVCKQLPDPGNCLQRTIGRYYYSSRADACRQFYYGGCAGYGNNFETKDECKKLCVKRKPLCPPGQRIVYCIADPCGVNKCPAYNTKKCKANYCGGCNAIFYDQHGIAIPHKPGRGRCHCKKGERLVQCVADPCIGATCPSHPNAKCRMRRCGSCVAEFVALNGTIINNC